VFLKEDGWDGVVGRYIVCIVIEIFRQLVAIDEHNGMMFGELVEVDAIAEQVGGGYEQGVAYVLTLHVADEGPDIGGVDGMLSVADLYEQGSAIQGGIAQEFFNVGIKSHGWQQSFYYLFQLQTGGLPAMGEQVLQVVVLAGMECMDQSFLFPHGRD
jgi:hypothetical protein